MPDVFISYTRGDRKRVALIAEALQAQGFDIWWDDATQPGKAGHDMVRKQLQTAHCVIACWSRASAKSDVVLSEATQGYNHQKLVPVTLQACDPPMPFNMVPSADLTEWNGEADNEYWVDTLAEIRRLVEKGGKLAAAVPPPAPVQTAAPAPAAARQNVAAPRETERAPRYQASRTRKKTGPGPARFIVGALVTIVALAGALWAGPKAFRYVEAKLTSPPAQTAAADPAEPAMPGPLVVEPLAPAATDIAQINAPLTSAPPAAALPAPSVVAPPQPPAAKSPKPAVAIKDMETCMQQIAKICGASANDFRVDGQFSTPERRLMRTSLFPNGAQLTELNFAACKAASGRRLMNSEGGRVACQAIAPARAAADGAAPPVRLAPPVTGVIGAQPMSATPSGQQIR